MADNIKLTAEEIIELRRLITELNGAIDDVSFNNLINSGPAAKKVLSDLRKEYKDWTSDISDSRSQFHKLSDEIKNTKSGVNEVAKVYKGLTSITRDIQYHQKGITELDEKGAKKLEEQLQKRRQELSNASALLDYEKEQLKNQKSLNEFDQLALHNEIKRLELKGRNGTLTKDEKKSLKEYRKEYQTLGDDISKINSEIKKKTELQSEIKGIINEEDANYKQIANTLKVITTQQKNLKNATGLTGAAVDGVGKAFSKLGLGGLSSAMGLDDAKKKMEEVAKDVTDSGNKVAGLNDKFKILGAGLKVIGSNMFKYLTDPLTIITGLVTGIVSGIKGLISLFEQTAKFNGDIAKNFALSANESQKIGDNLRTAASNDFFMTTEESRQAFDAMANATGTINSAFSDGKTVSAMNDMMTYAGYTAEEAGEFYKLGQLNNKSADEMITSLQGQLKVLQVNNKLRINEKQATEMVAKASATVRMNLGTNPKKLADAAFYATKLGMTLDEIASAAEQTLNFESAIQNQLEYQVLTGKEINIDAYQQAAASGDAAKAAEEMNRILEEQGDSVKGNFFAQEALAKTLGISREQLMKSLELQKIQKKVGGDIRDIEEAINRKMKNGLTFEQAAAEASEESYQSMVEQNKSAQVFSKTISEIKETFMNTIASSQEFKDLFSKENIAGYVNFIKDDLMPAVKAVAKGFVGIIGTLKEFKEPIKWLLENLGTISKVLLAIATVKVAANIVKGVGGLISSIKDLASGKFGKPGSKSNPIYVTPTSGGGMGGGMGMGGPGGAGTPGGPGTAGGPKSKWKSRLGKAGRLGGAALGGYMLYNQLFGDGESMTGSEMGDTALGMASMAPMMAGGGGMNPPTPSGAAPASPQTKKMTSTAQQVSQLKAQNPGMTSQQALQQVRQTTPPKSKGFFSGLLEKTGLTDVAGKAKGFFQGPIMKGIGKALGPILSLVMGVTDIMSIISDAKMRSSAGEQVDTGQLGKQILQSGVGALGQTLVWAIPGVGQAIGLADMALGMFGFSPIKWLTDNLIDLIPDNAFKGLGDLAVGKQQQAQQVQDGGLNPNGGPVVSTFQKGELTPVMQGIKEDNVYMTTNKPVQQVQDGYYSQTSQDNSAVIAAINKLAEVIMSNSNKEITLEMNGQTVGKVLTPIMSNPMVRQINNTSVLV